MSGTTQVARPLSPYVAILEDEITSDLRAHVKPEDLRDEVRKTLFAQLLKELRTVTDETQGAVQYGFQGPEQVAKLESKLERTLGYVQELIALRKSQHINPNFTLTSGVDSDA